MKFDRTYFLLAGALLILALLSSGRGEGRRGSGTGGGGTPTYPTGVRL